MSCLRSACSSPVEAPSGGSREVDPRCRRRPTASSTPLVASGIPSSHHNLLVTMRILRTYARVYTNDLEAVLAPLTAVTDESTSIRFAMPNGLELATIGRVLVVA